jgi:hypothetical protein
MAYVEEILIVIMIEIIVKGLFAFLPFISKYEVRRKGIAIRDNVN